RLVGLGQPGELCDAPPRASPGPVVDLDLLDRAEVPARLPHPHRRRPLLGTRARGPTREGKDATRHPPGTVPRASAFVWADCASKARITMRPPRRRLLPAPPQRPRTDA